jgi:hypothetical protein
MPCAPGVTVTPRCCAARLWRSGPSRGSSRWASAPTSCDHARGSRSVEVGQVLGEDLVDLTAQLGLDGTG